MYFPSFLGLAGYNCPEQQSLAEQYTSSSQPLRRFLSWLPDKLNFSKAAMLSKEAQDPDPQNHELQRRVVVPRHPLRSLCDAAGDRASCSPSYFRKLGSFPFLYVFLSALFFSPYSIFVFLQPTTHEIIRDIFVCLLVNELRFWYCFSSLFIKLYF